MSRPRLLDLFCGVGAASVGYHRAGFDVIGVDIHPQPDYPFTFHRADAIETAYFHGAEYDAIHASPPCQDRIAITAGNRKRPGWKDSHVNLVPHTREALAWVRDRTEIPTVIECGVGRHLRRDLTLCGEMFGLGVIRHRWFEIDGFDVPQPAERPHRGYVRGWRHGVYRDGPYLAVYGAGGGKGTVTEWQQAMGIDWTDDARSIAEAIPPAYTEHIGRHMLEQIELDRTSPHHTVTRRGA